MKNFMFKIFGAPHTFDLYQGSEGEIGYFQNFDNGGNENVKLTIHRMVSGKVSYSYLRYNFISCSGRPNSFLGMSVLFDKEYCKDTKKLFDLFDAIYKGVILTNAILLTELKDNPTAQAKYLVSKFDEAEAEVKKVENNIFNNLKKYFADDILPIDSSFLESNSMVKLNDQIDNERFVNALRKYSWVHISPEYSKNEDPIPNLEFLRNLDKTIEDVHKQMPIISVKAVKGYNIEGEVSNYLEKTNESLRKIFIWLEKEYKLKIGVNPNLYLQKQRELKERHDKLLELQKPLKELRNILRTTGVTSIPVTHPHAGATQEPLPNSSSDLQPSKIVSFYRKHKLKIIGVASVTIVMLIVFIFIIKQGDKLKINTEIVINEDTSNYKKNAEELGNQAKDNKDSAIASGEKACKADIERSQNKIPDESTSQNGRTNKLEAKNKQRKTPTNITFTIQLSPNKRFSVGEKLSAAAKSDLVNFLGGEWRFEDGLLANKSDNPTTVEIISVPSTGKSKLTYWVKDKQVAAVEIKINP